MMLALVILFLLPIKLLCFVPESEFFSFGQSEGDALLNHNDDQHSAVQNISIVFKFFYEYHSELYVNTNGLISFRKGISTFTSEAFPKIGDLIVLAPFWTDIDTRNCSSTCNIWYRESTKYSDIVKATSEVLKYFPIMKHFGANWTYIVTWENVPFFGASDVGINKRNTFQCILITDTESTFVIYNYNKIEWTTGTASRGDADTGIGGTPAQVGFNMGDDFHFYSVKGSRTADIINLPDMSNVGYPGKFAFRVDLRDIKPAPPTGDPGQCYLKAADIAFVLDVSHSIDVSFLRNFLTAVLSYVPINEIECQIGMISFSSKSKIDFYFDDYADKDVLLAHVANITNMRGASNLEDALVDVKQLFTYSNGSRSYAKRFTFIFTDGLMVQSNQLETAADKFEKSFKYGSCFSWNRCFCQTRSTRKNSNRFHQSTVSISRYDLEISTVFASSARMSLYVKFKISCTSRIKGEMHVLLEDSIYITRAELKEGKQFIYTFIEALLSFHLQNVKLSVDVFGNKIIEAIQLYDISGMKYKLGSVAVVKYSGIDVNQSSLIKHVQNIGTLSSSNSFMIFITSGKSLDLYLIKKLQNVVDNSKTNLITVGLGSDPDWDNLEDLASYGYFVFSSEDARLLARLMEKELHTTTCS
ncbi:Sushi, nidogen and EGF-like domain-containing protein 1,Alpha-tectorin [Mytilus coruscus]|uniref:Sushi, nidogen and EGF-like domain-containing protein 1,Alpha-tectorin n=1 Tax=Mytilus coruscus TaxID=42192 RepID=A0A6J8D5D3_MYTCO|nr:Sushi, nidogen and EGF-like domain-containing protein 1,Alpha-tectorin [Mytilus coruscus]